MAIETIEELFIEEIRDLYDAEKQLVKALPKMAKAASSEELKTAFQEHLEVTKGQVQRLEQVFELMDEKAKGKPCKAMKGLIEEGNEVAEEDALEQFTDLALIGAAQKVEHYEIAGYGTVRTMAEQMGNTEVAGLLEETLKEEEATDEKLTEIAKSIYEEVSTTSEDETEEEEEEEDVEA
jgi:ferritin-like metal-binding protein YciE